MRPIVFFHSDQWCLLIASVTVWYTGPQLPGQIHAFSYALWLQARPLANGVDAHHMRYHMLLGRTSTMSCMRDMPLQHGDRFRSRKPLIQRISQSHWFQYVNYFVRAQSLAEAWCSGFAVIGCLGIRLGPVSFHARDDNNGRHCRDDCWHHYSCVLPHASIFTCCTDAPEVNEFLTLEFRVGSRRHIPLHMRGAQQVNQKTYSAHFSFSSLFFLHRIRLLCLILPPSVLWYPYMIWRGVSDPDLDVWSSLMTRWAADVACFDIVCIKLSAGSALWHCSAQKAPDDRDAAVNHGWYSGNTICNPWVLMPCSAHWVLQDKQS